MPPSGTGRQFQAERKVRLGDVRADGVLRTDALTRYAQDVSNDDTTDAGVIDDMSWVVRRSTVHIARPARFGETLSFMTWCGGLGRRWAERRHQIRGDHGAEIEISTLWIFLDAETARPRLLTEQFLELYEPAAGGRAVNARLHHPDPGDDVVWKEWLTRVSDYDIAGHVNNAVYWLPVEQALESRFLNGGEVYPFTAEIEYRAGLPRGEIVELAGPIPAPSFAPERAPQEHISSALGATDSAGDRSADGRASGSTWMCWWRSGDQTKVAASARWTYALSGAELLDV